MPVRIGRWVMYALVDAAVIGVRARASHIDTEMVRAGVARQERFRREALWRATSRFTRRRADGGHMHDVLTTVGVDAEAMRAALSERLSAASPIND